MMSISKSGQFALGMGVSKNVVSFDTLFETDVEKPFHYGGEWSYCDLPYSK